MPRGTYVPLQPTLLAWALDQTGESSRSLAGALRVDRDVVDGWLAGESQPNTTQFRQIAAHLKLPTSTLLLKSPPEQGVPPSFRHPPGVGPERQITRDESQAVRAARRVQTVAKWIQARVDDLPSQYPAVPALTINDHPVEAAAALTQWLNWTTDIQVQANGPYAALKELRTRLEDHGILVLHLKMGKDGCRGFSLADDVWPIVVASRHYIPQARMFTYIHEVAHLATHTASMCMSTPATDLERWCEAVAGSFLLPEERAKAYMNALGLEHVSSVDDVTRIARRFKISLRGTAYRLQLLGLGDRDLFERVNRATDFPAPRSEDDAPPTETSADKRVREYGPTFSHLVVEAQDSRLLSQHDVLEYLDLPSSQLEAWRALATGEPTSK